MTDLVLARARPRRGVAGRPLAGDQQESPNRELETPRGQCPLSNNAGLPSFGASLPVNRQKLTNLILEKSGDAVTQWARQSFLLSFFLTAFVRQRTSTVRDLDGRMLSEMSMCHSRSPRSQRRCSFLRSTTSPQGTGTMVLMLVMLDSAQLYWTKVPLAAFISLYW